MINKEKADDLQEKCKNYEKKIFSYREILEKNSHEIQEYDRKYSETKLKCQEFEMLYTSLKIEYDHYRENILSKTNNNVFNHKRKNLDMPFARGKENVIPRANKSKAFDTIFRYLIAKSKGFNFKYNKYLNIVPKTSREDHLQENILIFEEFSNLIGSFFKEFGKIYDDVNEIESNVDSLYLENYNLKVLLLHSFKKIIGATIKRNGNQLNKNDLTEFYNQIKEVQVGFMESFDDIPIEEKEKAREKCLDFETFQNLQVQLPKINGLIVRSIEDISS